MYGLPSSAASSSARSRRFSPQRGARARCCPRCRLNPMPLLLSLHREARTRRRRSHRIDSLRLPAGLPGSSPRHRLLPEAGFRFRNRPNICPDIGPHFEGFRSVRSLSSRRLSNMASFLRFPGIPSPSSFLKEDLCLLKPDLMCNLPTDQA